MLSVHHTIVLMFFFSLNMVITKYLPKFNFSPLKLYNIDTVPFINSLLNGVSTNYLFITNPDIILNINNYTEKDIPESFYYISLYTLSYSVVDLYNGFVLNNFAYILHGVVVTSASIVFIINGNLHITFPAMFISTSSIFLNLIHDPNPIYKVFFVISFVFYRDIMFPIITYNYIQTADSSIAETVIIFLSLIVNMLNFYWTFKIINKFGKYIK